ncbi:hypothetical protein SE17_02750 [Kouleothrix aurantiaca]|uniref:DUF1684 domain-containing protein n=1 Tax=Kouleothrix aurantiaca TaxID=186479 RepID=A0A0N8PT57_9CHLR|nr:hypothetical protein SE17_02750 [Kouleothrix aurantiaca]
MRTIMTELEQFRAQKDTFFKTHPQSPLTAEQQAAFAGLRYFPENPDLRLVVPIETFAEKDTVVMQTSTGDERSYTRYGRLRFTVDGQDVTLTLYADEDSGAFFLPFVDALRGRETYGAGRYLDPEPLGDGQFLVDFNLAYNPYCAYNDDWSCPLTPVENWLAVPIRAGEKLFDEAKSLDA